MIRRALQLLEHSRLNTLTLTHTHIHTEGGKHLIARKQKSKKLILIENARLSINLQD